MSTSGNAYLRGGVEEVCTHHAGWATCACWHRAACDVAAAGESTPDKMLVFLHAVFVQCRLCAALYCISNTTAAHRTSKTARELRFACCFVWKPPRSLAHTAGTSAEPLTAGPRRKCACFGVAGICMHCGAVAAVACSLCCCHWVLC